MELSLEIKRTLRAIKCYRKMYYSTKDVGIKYKTFKLYMKYSAKFNRLVELGYRSRSNTLLII